MCSYNHSWLWLQSLCLSLFFLWFLESASCFVLFCFKGLSNQNNLSCFSFPGGVQNRKASAAAKTPKMFSKEHSCRHTVLPSQCLRNHTFIWNTDEVRHGGGFIQAVEKYFSVITSYLTCFVSVRATCVACAKLWFILLEVTNIFNLELIKCQKCTFKHKWLNIYGWHIFFICVIFLKGITWVGPNMPLLCSFCVMNIFV